MLVLAGASRDVGAAKVRLEEALRSGAALAKWNEMVAAQGGTSQVKVVFLLLAIELIWWGK